MATLGLVLGLTAIALCVALTLIRTSPLIGLSPLLEGAVVVSPSPWVWACQRWHSSGAEAGPSACPLRHSRLTS